jgi:very-short-patch-repair endonuclease
MVGGELVMANPLARRLRKAMTPQEVKLWVHLRSWRRDHGIHFRRQVPAFGYILDFACLRARLVVEVDGGQHGGERDAIRDRRLLDAGFRVLRVWNNDVDENLDGVLSVILKATRTPLTALRAVPPPRTGEG